VIRIVVADDQPAVRAGLVMILNSAPDLEVVGQASDGEQAVALGRALSPDVLVMDIQMPRMDGISATRELAGVCDVLILTTFDLDEYVFGALRAGAAGFLLKNSEADQLVSAVRLVASGDGMIAPAVTRRLIAAFAQTSAPAELASGLDLSVLTARERQVLDCVGRGLSNQDISTELAMAEATTKTHVSRILAKLGLRSRVQAAIVARSQTG
jgi:DNA-binding NarL/FixJ family response regulator